MKRSLLRFVSTAALILLAIAFSASCATKSEPQIDLSRCRIVYSENAGGYVKNTVVPRLQEKLKSEFGVDVPAVPDSKRPAKHEIVIGITSRSTDSVREQLESGRIKGYGYAVLSEGTRVFLISESELALYDATSELCFMLTDEKEPLVYRMNTEPLVSPAADTDDDTALADGADIRVMSYNVLNPDWNKRAPIYGRDEGVARVIKYYAPDVVGGQETAYVWHDALNDNLIYPKMYAPACQKTASGKWNMTTFLYNTQTVRLIEEYVIDLDENSDIRVFAVAVFEKISDGKRFVVTNTHPAPVSSQPENYARNFESILSLLGNELSKYEGLPLIMTGDFNTKEQSDTYREFMTVAGVSDAKYAADRLVRENSTCATFGQLPAAGNDVCIDHIFVNDRTDVKLFNVVIDHGVEKLSDHVPIYADIALSGN